MPANPCCAEPSRWRKLLSGLTLNVFLVGLVSFMTDASSEMIIPLMPIFFALASVGHGVAALVIIGLLEGLSEAVAALLKLLAGVWAMSLDSRIKISPPQGIGDGLVN